MSPGQAGKKKRIRSTVKQNQLADFAFARSLGSPQIQFAGSSPFYPFLFGTHLTWMINNMYLGIVMDGGRNLNRFYMPTTFSCEKVSGLMIFIPDC